MLNLSRKRQLENTKSRNTLSACAIFIHYINISINFYQTGQIPAVSRRWLNRVLLLSRDFERLLVRVDSKDWSLLLVSLFATARPAHGAEISVTTSLKEVHCCLKRLVKSAVPGWCCPVAPTLWKFALCFVICCFWAKVKGQMIFVVI